LTLFVIVADFYAIAAGIAEPFRALTIALALPDFAAGVRNGWEPPSRRGGGSGASLVGGYARIRRRYLDEWSTACRRPNTIERTLRRAVAGRTLAIAAATDVVAHREPNGVQAGAARLARAKRNRASTAAALTAIEETSRQAVREMRQLLQVLQPGDGSVELAPQPGLADVPRLVERLRGAGYDVDYTVSHCDAVSAALGLSCYRVIEESLTNVTRHSAATHIAISVAHEALVSLSVEDPGAARRSPDSPERGVGAGCSA
jgi:hypothetical protein